MSKMFIASTRRRRQQRGVALMIAIFALVVISLMGLAVLTVSTNGSRFGRQASGLEGATTAAQAGAEEARTLLRSRKGAPSPVLALLCPPAAPVIPPIPPVCSTTTAVYVVNYAGQPWVASDPYADPTFTTEPDPFNGGSVASGFVPPAGAQLINSSLAAIPGFKWARINVATENSLGQVVDSANPTLAPAMLVYDASPNPATNSPFGRFPCGPAPRLAATVCTGSALGNGATNPQPLFQITAFAVVGGYARIVTELVGQFPFAFTPPAPLTETGPNPSYSGPNSNNFTVSGIDGAGVYPKLPSIGGTSASAVTSINSGIPAVRDDCAHYGPSDPSCTSGPPPSTLVNISGPSSTSNPMPLNPLWNTEGTLTPATGLLGLFMQLRASADVVCGAGAAACPATAGDSTGFLDSNNPGLTVIQGDYTLPGSGGGTLLVTGNLTIDPNTTWNGLLLVIGTGRTIAGGNGTPTFNGAVFLANVCGNLGLVDPVGENPDLSNCTQLGNSDFKIATGGGNSGGGIRFNSADLNSANTNRAFSVLAYRERECDPAPGGVGPCVPSNNAN